MPAINYAHLSGVKETGRLAVAPGVELSFCDRGTGQPIVLVPGWTFSKDIFEKQIEALSQQYRVITYDPRSQGASSFTLEGNDYLTHAEDLVRLLGALKVSMPILVGCGAGAHTCLGFIKLAGPGAVAAYVSVDMPPRSMSSEKDAWVEASLDEVSAVHTIYLRDVRGHAEYMRNYVEKILIQRNLELHELSWLIAQALKCQPLIAAQLFASCMFSDNLASAIKISRTKPTMYILAQRWAEKAQSYLTGILPEARTVAFGGRMMFWEHPDAFNRVLHDFIQNYVLARSSNVISDDRFRNDGLNDAGVERLKGRVTNRFI